MLTQRQPLKAAATSQTVPPARTSERRYGPGRDAAPHRPTGTDEARAGEGDLEMHHTATVRTHPLPQAASTVYCTFGDDEEVLAVGVRPAPLSEVAGPQERVQRHIVEHLEDPAPIVQILDVPVLQKGNELANILKLVDKQTHVEQVIAVLKISNDSIQPRLVLRRPQMAEQLVEVPTVLSYALFQQSTAEQIIDIPVSGRGGGGARGGLPGSRARQNSTAADEEQIVDVPARGRLPDFLPSQGSTASSSSRLHDDADERIQGVFSHFSPAPKKCANQVRSCLESSAHGRRRLITAASSLTMRLLLIWPTVPWSPTFGGTKRSTCGCIFLQTRPGGTCCRIQPCAGMSRCDEVAGAAPSLCNDRCQSGVAEHVSFFTRQSTVASV